MARKPTSIAGHGCAAFAIVSLLTVAQVATSQETVRTTTMAPVIVNQFAAAGAGQPQAAAAVESGPPSRSAKSYKNPFASLPNLPPLNVPLRPGPISRWQRSGNVTKQPSPFASTVLSAAALPPVGDPISQAAIDWDQLPPADSLRAMQKSQHAAFDVAAVPDAIRPPDPVQFAPQNLTQPAWMLPDPSASSEGPNVGSVTPAGPAIVDPFEMPVAPPAGMVAASPAAPQSAKEPALFQAAGGTLSLPSADTPSAPRSGSSVLSLMISERIDSPDGWYAQAERAARTAATRDEFLSVAERCQRGLQSSPSAETASSLRRLAAWAHNRCGELWSDAGRQQEALAEFQSAIGLDANCALAIHNRGVTFAQQDKPADALRDFNRVIELNPGLAVAYRNRAELLTSLGRIDEALRDYDKAIEQLNEDAELYRARAHARQRLGRFDEALVDLNSSIRLAPNEAGSFTQRGSLAADRGDFEQAIRDFQQAIDINPKAAEAYRAQAWLLATCPDEQFRNGELAFALAVKGVQVAGRTDCFLLDALAAAHATSGQFDEAVDTAQQALAAAPADAAPAIRQRLKLYQQRKPFVSQPASTVRTVSHDAPTRPSPTPPPSPARR